MNLIEQKSTVSDAVRKHKKFLFVSIQLANNNGSLH